MVNTLLRKFVLLVLLLLPLGLVAQSVLATTDKFVIGAQGVEEVDGVEHFYFDVALEGSRIYTAYNMDITLPQGLTVPSDADGLCVYMLLNGEGGIYPDKRGVYSHSVQSAIQDNGNLRLICVSTSNQNLTATSGPLFRVYVEASPYAKPGDNEVRMTGLNLTALDDGKVLKYVPEGDLNTGVLTVPQQGIDMQITISAANKYGTCILPFAVSAMPEGLQAFTPGTIENDVLPLQAVASMEAYRPYILYAPEGFSKTLTGTPDPALYPEGSRVTLNGLTGLLVQQEVSEGYILQKKEGDTAPRFYAIGSTPFLLSAGKCYLSLPAESAARLIFQHPTTHISSVEAETPSSAVFYDLQGRRVEHLQPGGIYISEKRKIFVNN